MSAKPLLAIALLLVPAVRGAAQPYAYVTGAAADEVGVLDLQTNTLAGSFPLSGIPSGAVTASGGLFVARAQLDSVARMDPVTGATTSIAVGDGPAGLAVGVGRNPNPLGRHLPRVFVANRESDTVSVIDPIAGVVVATVPVGDAPMELAAHGTRLYVANWAAGTVTVVDTLENTVTGTVSVGRLPAGLAVNPRTGRLYVARFFDDAIAVVDPATLSVVRAIPVGRRPRALAMHAPTNRLFVASFEDGVVQVVDTVAERLVQQAPSGRPNPTDLLLSPDGQRLYTAHLTTGVTVRVLNAATLAPIGSVTGPEGPVSLAGFGLQAPTFEASPGPVRRALGDAARAWRGLLRRPPLASGAEPVEVPNAPEQVTIVDGTFDPADWQILPNTSAQVTTQEATGGNPGFWRRSQHMGLPTWTDKYHLLVDPARQYDPASQGAIASIDVFIDNRLFTPGNSDVTPVVQQGGVLYRAFPDIFTNMSWQTTTFPTLTPESFWGPAASRPDFGPTGGVLTFGYLLTTASTDAAIVHGVDNFRVTVHPSGSGSAGRIRFRRTGDAVVTGELYHVFLERVGGTEGEVTATLRYLPSSGGQQETVVTWANNDGAPKSVPFLFLFATDSILTERFRIVNVTGGAAIDTPSAMVVLQYPEDWPLQPFVVGLQVLFASPSPVFLALLAVPALLAALRRRSGGGSPSR
jgi:YVTN family beta-propeller protein